MFIESYVLPMAFLFSACKLIPRLYGDILLFGENISHMWRFCKYDEITIHLSSIVFGMTIMFFYILVAVMLLIRKNLNVKPDKVSDILIPLIGTFYFLIFNLLPFLPEGMNEQLTEGRVMAALTIMGFGFALAGVVISFKSVMDLKYSFGIYVQVRDIVTTGIYKHVRHPMYFGYLLLWIGMGLIEFRPFHILVFMLAAVFSITRAVLEENKLIATSADYRDYVSRTPFIFPVLFRREKGLIQEPDPSAE